jgi:hypothetical protein
MCACLCDAQAVALSPQHVLIPSQALWKTVEPLLARFHSDRVVWLKGEADQNSLNQLGTLLGRATLTNVLGAVPSFAAG